MPIVNETGRRYGRLLVLERAPDLAHNNRRRTMWLCRCDCGRITTIRAEVLRRGEAQGCGCLRAKSHLIHGHGREKPTPEYSAWINAKQRCTNTRSRNYARYGARGIYMCQAWSDDFTVFLRDMGPRPQGHSLDRIDNDGPYAPGNCRWASKETQMNNTCRNLYITVGDRRLTLRQAATAFSLPYPRLLKRQQLGWTDEEIVSK